MPLAFAEEDLVHARHWPFQGPHPPPLALLLFAGGGGGGVWQGGRKVLEWVGWGIKRAGNGREWVRSRNGSPTRPRPLTVRSDAPARSTVTRFVLPCLLDSGFEFLNLSLLLERQTA